MTSAEDLSRKRSRILPRRLRIFSPGESLDTTAALQVATRYVAIPYLAAVAVATLASTRQGRVPVVGPATVAAGVAAIAAAELTRAWMARRGKVVAPWLIFLLLGTLHSLVGVNAWNSGGLDGGLWLSLTVLSSIGGALLPMHLSVLNGFFGALVLLAVATVDGQIDREHLATLALGTAFVGMGSPTASLFRDVIVREAKRRLGQQVSQLELYNLTLTAVIQSMTEGLVGCDREGRVELWNRRMESLTGIPEFEAVERLVTEVLHFVSAEGPIGPEENPLLRAVEGPVFAGSVLGGSPGEIAVLSASGERVPVTVAAAPLMRGQEAAGVVAVVVDVSRERELSQMRESLVSMVSHELRTPLTTIMGFSELLLEEGFDEEQYRECASEILAAATRLSSLVDDLLSTAALERGSIELNRRMVALSSLIERSISSFLPGERERISTRVEEAYLFVDPDRIIQVLENLIGNALKYSEPSTMVEVTSRQLDRWVHISVADRGYGMDSQTLASLFTMFSRSSDERIRSIPGTGLGLYIARKLVYMHGGDIEVQSREGEGSTFTVILPVGMPSWAAADEAWSGRGTLR